MLLWPGIAEYDTVTVLARLLKARDVGLDDDVCEIRDLERGSHESTDPPPAAD